MEKMKEVWKKAKKMACAVWCKICPWCKCCKKKPAKKKAAKKKSKKKTK